MAVKSLAVAAVLLVFFSCLCQAATINVPGPGASTIQQGIDIASPSDTVLVAPGVYHESITIPKSLVVKSSDGAQTTIIDGNSATENYYMVSIDADNVILDGFTITNPLYSGVADASGVVIGSVSKNSNIRITNCIIHDIGNPARSGVSFGTFGINSGPVDQLEIDHNVIYNIADSGNDFVDAGIFVYGNDVSSAATNIGVHDNVVYNVGSPSTADTCIYVGENSSVITVTTNSVWPNVWNNTSGEYGIATRPDSLSSISVTGNFVTKAGIAGIRLRNPCGDAVYGNNVYLNPTGILVNDTSSGANASLNNIWGNTTYGLDNLAELLPANGNWWGAANGPSGVGGGSGDAVAGLVTLIPFLTAPTGRMSLEPAVPVVYVGPGQDVHLTLSQSGLAVGSMGFVAYLTFRPDLLSFTSATYTPTPYGVPSPPVVGNGQVMLAAQAAVGWTSADAALADVVFTAGSTDGPTAVTFGTSSSSPQITPPTRLFDRFSSHNVPVTSDSTTIYVDAIPPSVSIVSAKQNGIELIGGPTKATVGPVNITVTASDASSGLAGHPAVTVTPHGGSAEAATYVNESPVGTFNYTWSVTDTTPTGSAEINASAADNVGNVGHATPQAFTIAGPRLTLNIQLEGIVGGSVTRTMKVLLGGTGVLQLEYNLPVTFVNQIGTLAFDDITNLPGYSCVSVKDAQHTVYSTLSIVHSAPGQYVANLTGSDKLLGGDVDNNDVVDVYDYGVIAVQWNTMGHPLAPPALDGDIDDNGKVYKEDFRIFWSHFLTRGDAPCGVLPGQLPTPASRITVAQLAPLVGGLTNARKADLNMDGYIDGADVRLFLYRNVL